MDYLPDTQPAATFFRDSLVTIFYTYPEPTPSRPPPEDRTEFERAAALTRNTRERAISSSPAPHSARLTQLTLRKNNKRLIRRDAGRFPVAANCSSHTGESSSGIGLAANSFLPIRL